MNSLVLRPFFTRICCTVALMSLIDGRVTGFTAIWSISFNITISHAGAGIEPAFYRPTVCQQ